MIYTTVKKDGFEGILFSGNRKKEKVVIVMSGSNGGMSLTEKEARFYQQNGIPALALALFKTKQTQKDLDRVPIEYVEKAIIKLLNTLFIVKLFPFIPLTMGISGEPYWFVGRRSNYNY